MFTWDVIRAATRLEDSDIRYILKACLRRTVPKGPLTSGETLVMLVYDLLKQLGFTTEDLTSILLHCGDRLLEIGKGYEMLRKGDKVEPVTLQILDNAWVMFSGNEKAYGFRQMESAKRLPVPVLSLGIVLPRLYQRALSVVSPPAGRPPEGAATPPPKSAASDDG